MKVEIIIQPAQKKGYSWEYHFIGKHEYIEYKPIRYIKLLALFA